MAAARHVLQTPRLEMREVALGDAGFFLRLLNEPSWLENIGDRGVRSTADAEDYIRSRIWPHYQAHGYGLYALQLRSIPLPIGLCGLVKRDFLAAPDLGFALLPDFVGFGYAREAAQAVMTYAHGKLAIERLYAIVSRGNQRSVRLLGDLGFRYQGPCLIPSGEEVELYVTA
jgi:[ribosomal protein S5]-alanine N-acetyltransferase